MVDPKLERRTVTLMSLLTWDLWVMPFESRVTARWAHSWTARENFMSCTTRNERQNPITVTKVCVR